MATYSSRKPAWGQKENQQETPADKKRKMVVSGASGLKVRSHRGVLSVVNLRAEGNAVRKSLEAANPSKAGMAAVAGDGSSTSPDCVDALLNLKMVGKTKFDFKGKSEQMMDYIKKLRTCIRAFQELDRNHTQEKLEQLKQIEAQRLSRVESETQMRNQYLQLESGYGELKALYSQLQQELNQEQAAKQALVRVEEKHVETIQSREKDITMLNGQIEKLQSDLISSNKQVSVLQDINKRLQEYNTSLQQYNSKLQVDASNAAEAMSRTQKEKAAIMENLSTLRGSTTSLNAQLAATKASLQDKIQQHKDAVEEASRLRMDIQRCTEDRDQLASQVSSFEAENAMYKECTGKSVAEIKLISNKALALEESYTTANERIKSLRQQLEITQHKLEVAESQLELSRGESATQGMKYAEISERLVETERKVKEGEMLRRKLHNTILELKGNIRVFCRVRPLMVEEDEGNESPSVQFPSSTDLEGRAIELVQPSGGPKHCFQFDKVFGPDVKQAGVFEEISQLVQSALDGYKVCIFAYGQTGSGKTHTMIGNPEIPDEGGVIPRSLEQVFESSQALIAQGWKFCMQASMLEIYNETIRDLLAKGPVNGDVKQMYVVKHDPSGNTSVSDLTLVEVATWKEVSNLLHRASQSRSTSKTLMNEQSSRSHCVFTLRISGVNEGTEQAVHGVLNLIDLAGSERLSRSGATGDRLKETQAINKSLASLGDVIMAIANKDPHVPFRNSKLTYLLQPCLGGDSKTLMFVNISPDMKSLNESLCSLRFAAKVNACEIGVPHRQTSLSIRSS
ncbi:kinesin-like protein KIN-14N [Physcomitrium patens]|uniref:Kinesin-like protein n=1 Tax=Physcomitrium patens TaxID=3218 RepID=A0A2K1KBE3_PHYPA|nr:kinesin-like protein KIN-14N [Physcomitrium patens]PNR51089.1 hypothetical protein PHYPA_010275 [Physcomitrium patens]|eukprot:XP_024381679.1 kinesin-like protein KIN-14N [Physcomitrella patens]